ncbi:MAG TPA: peroxiredoxin [Sphingomonadales bacterium]|nr:peroxiredoxin [Sphingomonadales bacterium]
MTIQPGERIPNIKLSTMGVSGPEAVETEKLFAGKKAVLFSVPGAFTPTCSAKHLPGFVQNAGEFFAKGVDLIVCTAVNDAFVMGAWGEGQGAKGKVMMLADGNGALVKALGLMLDASAYGMGARGKRFSMILEDGVVKTLNVEEPGAFKVSSAEHALGQL